nr:MAG TPA_asm: hypothetical protein [Caudoviricetes sp.]
MDSKAVVTVQWISYSLNYKLIFKINFCQILSINTK